MENEKIKRQFEKIEIDDVESLKQPTIYFFLKNHRFSENYIKNLRNITDAICLNGETVNIRAKIKNGDVLEIARNPNKPTAFVPCKANLNILFEDEDYLIVNKPHNLTCNPTRSHYSNNLGSQVCTYMQAKDPNFVLRILGRLDRETAGIIVIAKNVLAYNRMTDLEKEYHAICHGKIEEDFTINKPILTVTQNGINEMKRVVSPQGKSAITHIHVLRTFSVGFSTKTNQVSDAEKSKKAQFSYTLISLHLETGRTHQIRVHLSDAGHPLVGDTLYGNDFPYENENSTCLSSIQNTTSQPHTMLLLKKISFTHFRTKEKIALEVPYPQNWVMMLSAVDD